MARRGIFLIQGIRLCERSAWRRSGFRLHFLSLSRLRESVGELFSNDVIVVTSQLCLQRVPRKPSVLSANSQSVGAGVVLKLWLTDMRKGKFYSYIELESKPAGPQRREKIVISLISRRLRVVKVLSSTLDPLGGEAFGVHLAHSHE